MGVDRARGCLSLFIRQDMTGQRGALLGCAGVNMSTSRLTYPGRVALKCDSGEVLKSNTEEEKHDYLSNNPGIFGMRVVFFF